MITTNTKLLGEGRERQQQSSINKWNIHRVAMANYIAR